MRGRVVVIAVSAAVCLLAVGANEKPPETYQKAMKDLGAANQSLRTNVTAKDYRGHCEGCGNFQSVVRCGRRVALDAEECRGRRQARLRDGSKAAGNLETAARRRTKKV